MQIFIILKMKFERQMSFGSWRYCRRKRMKMDTWSIHIFPTTEVSLSFFGSAFACLQTLCLGFFLPSGISPHLRKIFESSPAHPERPVLRTDQHRTVTYERDSQPPTASEAAQDWLGLWRYTSSKSKRSHPNVVSRRIQKDKVSECQVRKCKRDRWKDYSGAMLGNSNIGGVAMNKNNIELNDTVQWKSRLAFDSQYKQFLLIVPLKYFPQSSSFLLGEGKGVPFLFQKIVANPYPTHDCTRRSRTCEGRSIWHNRSGNGGTQTFFILVS